MNLTLVTHDHVFIQIQGNEMNIYMYNVHLKTTAILPQFYYKITFCKNTYLVYTQALDKFKITIRYNSINRSKFTAFQQSMFLQ